MECHFSSKFVELRYLRDIQAKACECLRITKEYHNGIRITGINCHLQSELTLFVICHISRCPILLAEIPITNPLRCFSKTAFKSSILSGSFVGINEYSAQTHESDEVSVLYSRCSRFESFDQIIDYPK